MYTANTMSSSFEALGMSLLHSSTQANPDDEKVESTREAARVLVDAVKNNLRPSDIITRESIENAVSLIMAVGGSTNAVLHYLAIAHSAGIAWTIDDFERVRRKVPVLCDLKPSASTSPRPAQRGRHPAGAEDPACERPSARRLHDDHRQDDGADAGRHPGRAAGRPGRDPAVFQADLRPGTSCDPERQSLTEGCVAKITGLKNPSITGPARVFDSEDAAMEAILADRIKPGDVLVIRYEARRGPGHARDAVAHLRLIGKGSAKASAHYRRALFRRHLGMVVGMSRPKRMSAARLR